MVRKRRARTLVETLAVIILLCGAGVAVGYFGFHQDWKLLRDWGVLPKRAPKLPKSEYFEPMGISYHHVMMGLDKVFKMKEAPLSLVEMRQPRYFATDEETLATLEIRGEKENIGLARLTVWMPRVGLTPHQYHTQQTISYNLMETFILNTVPGTFPRPWLKELLAGYRKGQDMAATKVSSGRKLIIRQDRTKRDMIHVIVLKDK